MTERTGCEARQYSDQMHCGRCGLQWDMNDDDPPECAQIRRAKDRGRAVADEWLRKMFAMLDT